MTRYWKCARTELTHLPAYDIGVERQILEPIGARVESVDINDWDAFSREAPTIDALLLLRGNLTANHIALLGRCRIIAVYSAGTDRVDVSEATARRIMVTNVPHYAVDEVSSHAVALLLSIARKILVADAAVRMGDWHIKPVAPLHRIAGKTLGLLGFGNIARATARKGEALGLHVIACDPYLEPRVFLEEDATRVDLETCLGASDYLSIHLPLTPETLGIVGRDALSLMKPSAILINTSRGGVLDEVALAEALRLGRLAGAGLDVLATEPPSPDHPLLSAPNVVLSGHIAWYSEESIVQMQQEAAEQVALALSGIRPKYLVNRDAQPPCTGSDRCERP